MTRSVVWPLSWLSGCVAGAYVGHSITEPGLIVIEFWLLVVAELALAFVCAGGRDEPGPSLTWTTDMGGAPWQRSSPSSTRTSC